MNAKKKEEDVFDRLVHWATKYKYMKWFAPIYARFKEFLLYALMGLGTVIIAIWTYSIFTEILGWHILVGNAVSWVFATAFAFFSNRKWVFTSHDDGVGAFFYQLFTFSFGRFLTLLLEEWIFCPDRCYRGKLLYKQTFGFFQRKKPCTCSYPRPSFPQKIKRNGRV